jgi:hypothetical protein
LVSFASLNQLLHGLEDVLSVDAVFTDQLCGLATTSDFVNGQVNDFDVRLISQSSHHRFTETT